MREKVNSLKSAPESLFIESTLCTLPESWSPANSDGLRNVLHKANIRVIIAEGKEWDSKWVSFIIGCSQDSKHIILFNSGSDNSDAPVWITDFGYVETKDNFYQRLKKIQYEWVPIIFKKIARKVLESNGYALHDSGLILAIEKGDRNIVRNYMDAGFSVNTRNEEGVPILSIAIEHQSVSTVKMLMFLGADVNGIRMDRGNTPIMDAAAVGHLELVNYLLSYSPDLEIVSKNGQTAAMLAVGNGHVEVGLSLLKRGSDPHKKDLLGMSVLSYAKLYKYKKIIDFLETK